MSDRVIYGCREGRLRVVGTGVPVPSPEWEKLTTLVSAAEIPGSNGRARGRRLVVHHMPVRVTVAAPAMAPAAASDRIVRTDGGANRDDSDEEKDELNVTTHGRALLFSKNPDISKLSRPKTPSGARPIWHESSSENAVRRCSEKRGASTGLLTAER